MRFGDIVSMDYLPKLRLMLIGLNPYATRSHPSGQPVWDALVLADDDRDAELVWDIGEIVTIPLGVRGFVLIEETE